MTTITINDLTTGAVNGTGVFDVLMRANKAHLDQERDKGSIRGPEYSQVYLGQLQAALSTALSFVAQRDKIGLEVQLLQKQVDLADKQIAQITAQIELTQQQILNAKQDALLSAAQVEKVNAEKAQVIAATLNIPKQGALIDAQKDVALQQKLNDVIQGTVLTAQECLLRSQFDGSQATNLKTASETDLLKQKIVTEKAQTIELGVDENSVLGTQKKLYIAQTNGFQRDAEQKAVKIWVDSWSSRRMTDEGTVADSTNKLDDVTGGRLMTKLLAGINA